MSSVLRGLILVSLLAAPASAAEMTSLYHDISLKSCRDMNPRPVAQRGDHDTVPYRCKPFAGHAITITQWPNGRELRIDPPGSAAPDAQVRMLSGLGDKIEWRGEKTATGLTPRAAIVRATWMAEAGKLHSVLVILKVEPGRICRAAVIDATLNRNANEVARAAVDGPMQSFECAEPVRILGQHSDAVLSARDGQF